MALNLYLDDCANADLLAELLAQAGHSVVRPTDADVQMKGKEDAEHFRYAVEHGLTIITKNPPDFLDLHVSDQNHLGILAVYQDNDVRRDMKPADIVKAISKLEYAAQSGGDPIHGRFHNLNLWR